MLKITVDNGLKLLLLEVNQAEQLFSLIDSCRFYLKEWLPWLDTVKTVEDSATFIESAKKQYISNNGLHLGIWYQGKLVGVIGYDLNPYNRIIKIGYWLDKEYNGRGIMIKSCRALIEYAFGRLSLNRVEIRCAEANYKSRAIPERLGFIKEGLVREAEWLYDHYVDHVIYGLLQKDWNRGLKDRQEIAGNRFYEEIARAQGTITRSRVSIEHVALWTNNLEVMKDFYVKFFHGTTGVKYLNPKTGFESYFISFACGGRLELMTSPAVRGAKGGPKINSGYSHVAMSVGSKEKVSELTTTLEDWGYKVLSYPRTTGDGYYESCVADPEGNKVEITV